MHFEAGHLYHIYNQGNNRQKIFFNRDNYLFFLKKINKHILPYCDVLAWCLMPNHFHLMVRVNRLEVDVTSDATTEGFALSETLSKQRNINQSIGILLRSYTNAINKQRKRSGSLFRKETKAECITYSESVTPSFLNTKEGTVFFTEQAEKEYPQICYSYILNNPVCAGLTTKAVDWEFSSTRDAMGKRDGKLINREVIKEYGLMF